MHLLLTFNKEFQPIANINNGDIYLEFQDELNSPVYDIQSPYFK